MKRLWAWLILALIATPAAAQDGFFPSAPVRNDPCRENGAPAPIIRPFEARWYAAQLQAAGEESLYQRSLKGAYPGRTVRFTWLRSFHAPIVVRVDGLGTASASLNATQLSGEGG